MYGLRLIWSTDNARPSANYLWFLIVDLILYLREIFIFNEKWLFLLVEGIEHFKSFYSQVKWTEHLLLWLQVVINIIFFVLGLDLVAFFSK